MAQMKIRKSQVSGLPEELQALEDVDHALDQAIGNETTRALAAEGVLQQAIDAEKARAEAAELVLTNDLAAEVARATAAEGVLSTQIASEVTRATGEESRIESLLNQEVADRTQAVADEKSRAEGAEAALQAAIDGEIARATGVEAGLQSAIDFITSNTDQAALDSLTEIVAAFQTADNDINQAITDLSASAATARATMRGELDAEDVRLQGEIDSLSSDNTARFDGLAESKQTLGGWVDHSDNSGRKVAGPYPFFGGVVMGKSLHCNGLRLEEGAGKDFELEMDEVNQEYKVVVSADYADEIDPDIYGHNSSFVFRVFHG